MRNENDVPLLKNLADKIGNSVADRVSIGKFFGEILVDKIGNSVAERSHVDDFESPRGFDNFLKVTDRGGRIMTLLTKKSSDLDIN